MKEQKIIFTVLPNGKTKEGNAEERLKISLFVSPRLYTDEGLPEPHLEQFPDFLHWPQKVKKMEFDFKFDNGAIIRNAPETGDLDAKLWDELFKPETYVRPYQFKDLSKRAIRTFPVQDVMKYIKDKYTTIAEGSPSSLPLLVPRRDDDGNLIDDIDSTLESLIDEMGDLLQPEKVILCTIQKEYGQFMEVLRYAETKDILDYLLPYILPCLKRHKLSLHVDKVRIAKEDKNLWKIFDGSNTYYIEDTGSELNLFYYKSIYSRIDEELEKSKVLKPGELYGYSKEKLDFLQANRYYDRKEVDNPYYFKPNASMAPPAPEVEKIDFHQMLSTLGDHPILLRKLALVLDFEVPAPEKPFKEVQATPVWGSGNQPSSFNINLENPYTQCQVGNKFFISMPKPGSKLKGRMLNLAGASDDHKGTNSVYDLVQIDPDGASLQIVDSSLSMGRQIKRRYLHTLPKEKADGIIQDCTFISSHFNEVIESIKGLDYNEFSLSPDAKISRTAPNRWMITDKGRTLELEHTGKDTLHLYKKMGVSYDQADDAGLPSLRSAGIALTETERAYRLYNLFVKTQELDSDYSAGTKTVLYADDLLRGYRVDIFDQDADDPEWRSLCQRTGKYSFPETNAGDVEIDDEGYVKGGSTTSKDAQASDLYLHETVFRWTGWSLCAQRPGKTIVSKPGTREEDLFTWEDVPQDNSRLVKFLENYLNARWAAEAVITKSGNKKKITVTGNDGAVTLVLGTDGKVTLTNLDGREHIFLTRSVNSKTEVHNVINTQDEEPGVIKNEAVTEFKLESDIKAKPESLPRLRFGHTYQLRARMVDLAGNSLLLKEADGSTASDSIHYVRYEPVLPPVLVPRTQFSEGESLERMVIRSNFDVTAGDFAELEEVKGIFEGGGVGYSYTDNNERHIAPEKTSQLAAETHGEFDAYIGKGKDNKKGFNIALKEEGRLSDEFIVDINTGEKTIQVTPAPTSISINGENGGHYIIHEEESLILPYLPDPMSQGASLQNLPGLSSSGTPGLDKVIDPVLGMNLLKVPFGLNWPDARPFRIRIVERPGMMGPGNCQETFDNLEDPPQWDETGRILTIFIPKAEQARIRYSTFISKEDLERMGIWKWIKNSPSKDDLARYAVSGAHWMLTPYREMVLVHAVLQPLCEPQISSIQSLKKKIGDTHSSVEGELKLNSRSTEKIELLATWTEPVDDLADEGPKTMDINANAFDVTINAGAGNSIQLPLKKCVEHRHEFGDTKYRRLKYYLVGTTRFREYFHPDLTEAQTISLDWDKVPGDDNEKLMDFLLKNRQLEYTSSANIVKSPDEMELEIEEGGLVTTLTLNHDRNAVRVTASGGEYVYPVSRENSPELSVKRERITRRGRAIEADVMNSARPAAPKIQYLLPTFGWSQKGGQAEKGHWKTFERRRIGGGLRVYMDRPWYSSGDGELLGVVLYPHTVSDDLKPYVTQWGMDPIRKSTIPKGILRINDFTDYKASLEDLSLEETGPAMQKFDVVGFKPEYNSERQLWSCDIQFDPDKVISYFPFVRLALARFQPNSITHAHLSRVVLTDFIQLANDRKLNIEFQDADTVYVSLEGYGTGDRDSSRVEVTIEELQPGAHPELGWVAIGGSKRQSNPLTLALKPLNVQTYLWKWEGRLKLPEARTKRRLRLVVKEFEKYRADKEFQLFSLSYFPFQQPTKEVERLVYADTVEL